MVTDKDSYTIDKVEESVCNLLDVDRCDIRSNNQTANVTLARGFIFFILHKNKGFSAGKISQLYNRSPRNVFWHNDKIKHFLKQRTYKELFERVLECL